MERNFETVMIEQCAPVLAGLKAAGLFRQESRDRAAFYAAVAGWDARLASKGVRVTVLKECPHSPWYLVYLYRPARLGDALSRPEVAAFLQGEGYRLPSDPASPAGCADLLRQLAGRLACGEGFPHEIGVFLGYPLGDVVGFPRRRPPALCPAEQVHRHLPAPVPQRDAGAQADGGGVSRAKFAKSITTFVLAVC